MALTSSGQITLDQMHVEAGGTTQTLATINDADIRGLLSPTPASLAEQGFDDYYGASAVVLDLEGTGNIADNSSALDTAISSSNPMSISGFTSAGDLVVFCAASRTNMDSSVTWSGMTFTNRLSTSSSFYGSPGRLCYTGVWASNNSNPYISNVMTYDGSTLTGMHGVFSGAGNVIQSATAGSNTNQASTYSMPSLSSYSGSSEPSGFITLFMFEVRDEGTVNSSNTAVTPPSGYTLVQKRQAFTSKGKGTVVAMAYKASSSTAAESGSWSLGTHLANEVYASAATFRVGS